MATFSRRGQEDRLERRSKGVVYDPAISPVRLAFYLIRRPYRDVF